MSNVKRRLTPVAAALVLSATPALAESDMNFEGDVMVVTGSRVEQKLEDVAGSVSVIEAEQIERQLSHSLADVFRYDPSIVSSGHAGQPQQLSVRGISGNRLIYIKDGRRLNDGYAGGRGLLIGRGYLDVSQVERVEVAKSAASSLYGSDGLGGIVVITTPDPKDVLAGEKYFTRIGAGYRGTSEEFHSHATHAQDWGKSQGLFSASIRQGNETQNYSETLPGFDYDSLSLLGKVNWDLSDQQALKLTVDGYRQDSEQIISPQANETRETDEQFALSLNYDSHIANAWYDNHSAQLYVSDYQQQSDQLKANMGQQGPYLDQNDYRFEQQILGARWQGHKEFSDSQWQQQWVYGLDVDYYDTARPRVKTRTLADGTVLLDQESQKTFPGAQTLLSGVFIQNNIEMLTSPLQFVAGLRLDHYRMSPKDSALYNEDNFGDITETALSPKIGVIYDLTDNLNLYGQYSQGFKIPPHDQAYQSHGVEPFYRILPNPDLEPETSHTSELGLRYQKDGTSFNVSAYYADFDDFIETSVVSVTPSPIPGVQRTEFQYQNIDQARIYGAEAQLSFYLTDQWLLRAAAAYASGKDGETDQYLASLTPLTANLDISYQHGPYDVSVRVTAASDMDRVPAEDAITSSGWATLDLLAGAELGQWRLNIALLNVLDKEYVPYSLIAGQDANSPVDQFTQPARSLSAQASYTF